MNRQLITPPVSASSAARAEFHKLACQQIELYRLSRQYSRLPHWVCVLIAKSYNRHECLARSYSLVSTARAPASPALAGQGLATSQVSAGHQFPKGNTAAYVTRFITQ